MLIALLLLSYGCLANVYVIWLFLTVPCVCLQCEIVVFPDHTRLLFGLWSVNLTLSGHILLFLLNIYCLSKDLGHSK